MAQQTHMLNGERTSLNEQRSTGNPLYSYNLFPSFGKTILGLKCFASSKSIKA